MRMLLALPLLALAVGCTAEATEKASAEFAYVTNGKSQFWTLAAAGVAAGAAEADVACEVRMPESIVDQKRVVEDLLSRGIDGIAISPIDGANQTELLNEACANTIVITQDSDAPKSERRCFVGVDNYVAGRMCGELIANTLPNGGSIVLFVGRLEQDNARKRRQGVIDVLLGRSADSTRYDEPGAKLEGNGYVILDTRTDQFDFARAKQNAEDALAQHPDLSCMVGLFSYNVPQCLEALKGADKLGQVTVIGFDEEDPTLQGIADGHVAGTVVQDPYRYGSESVRVLAALATGDGSAVPENQFVHVPARVIGPNNVAEFRANLAKLLGK